MTGKIKRLVKDRGFGFIGPEEKGQDVFFHRSALKGCQFEDLNEGQEVTFEIEMQAGKPGPRARDVFRI